MHIKVVATAAVIVCFGFSAHAQSGKEVAVQQCVLGAMTVKRDQGPVYIERCMGIAGYDVKWTCTAIDTGHIAPDLQFVRASCFKPRSWIEQKTEDLDFTLNKCKMSWSECWAVRPSLDHLQDSFGLPPQ